MSAFTIPSVVPIHSVTIGTSFCSTWTTSTTGGSEVFAPCVLLEQPTEPTKLVTIRQIVVHFIIGGIQRWVFILSSGELLRAIPSMMRRLDGRIPLCPGAEQTTRF